MSGSLSHSPADVLAKLLIALGHGAAPATDEDYVDDAWPIRVDQEADLPDKHITIYNTQGRLDGRLQTSGRMIEHHGFQVRIRDTSSSGGYAKARAIAVALDEDVYYSAVTISASEYLVYGVSRTGDVIPLPREKPSSERYVFTINGVVTLKQVS